ncbi:alpha/beta hydrolase [Sinorhizobium meliloti]|uniref:alpha/beta hydrolase n=1 Tax=Rhizobium meliloti TaxID=382 RepID=UPI0004812E17|nr:alpha/beta hydrolase [Sinorhizobium meliloti]MDE4615946.1 alpha/beta hydrolase [Sinorhizobium meliloti]
MISDHYFDGNKSIDTAMANALAKQRELQEFDGGKPRTLADDRAQQERLAWYWLEGAPFVEHVVGLRLPGPRGQLDARLYKPSNSDGKPVILFLHGGGRARGSIATGEWICRALASETGFPVISLAYSLAPEFPFPHALEDMRAAMDWCADQGKKWGFDGNRIFVSGTSAGGHFSVTLSLARLRARETMPVGIVSFYGSFSDDFETESFKLYGGGQYGLSRVRMEQYMRWYVPTSERLDNPLIFPIHASDDDVSRLPPVWLGIPELCISRSGAFAFADRLRANGVATSIAYCANLVHGFAFYARAVPEAREAISLAASFIVDRASN